MLAATCFPLALSLAVGEYARLDAGAIARRLRAEAPQALHALRQRLESDPPAAPATDTLRFQVAR